MNINIINKLFIALLFFAGVAAGLQQVQAEQIAGRSIDIVINQADPAAPELVSVGLGFNNPDPYMLTFTSNYFLFKEEDTAGNVLYEGQVKRTKLEYFGTPDPDAPHPPSREVHESPLTINFPYYKDATKVKVYDEGGTLVFDIDLATYNLGPTPTPMPRVMDCNKCGYCPDKDKQPGNLKACMQCIYPDYVDRPEDTLKIDPVTLQPPLPRPGTYYTQIGCIDVGIAGFQDDAAAGGVVNAILTRLIFPVTGVLALLSLIYGAFLMMTAQGNEEQLIRGRKWIYGAIIGVVFTFMAILLVRIIGGEVLKIPGINI